jgi:hypothetical protein
VGQQRLYEEPLTLECGHGDQAQVIVKNVENQDLSHEIRSGKYGADIRQVLPSRVAGGLVPGQQLGFGSRMLPNEPLQAC